MRRFLATCAMVVPTLLAAACGGGNSDGTPEPAPSDTTSTTPGAVETGPADEAAAEVEITANWEKFLKSGTSKSDAVALLENGDQLGAALKKAEEENEATGGKRSAKVKTIVFTSATRANVNYELHAAGQVLNSAGEAVLQDGVWKVSAATFCTLVVLGNGSRPVKGCPS
jgi:hypothetical protein